MVRVQLRIRSGLAIQSLSLSNKDLRGLRVRGRALVSLCRQLNHAAGDVSCSGFVKLASYLRLDARACVEMEICTME